MSRFYKTAITMLLLTLVSCSSKKVMEDNHAKFEDINKEFGQVVKIDEIKPAEVAGKKSKDKKLKVTQQQLETESAQADKAVDVDKLKDAKGNDKQSPTGAADKPSKPAAPEKSETTTTATSKPKRVVKEAAREPPIEDSENFSGRRPLVDPYHEDEKIVLAVNYFNVEAGEIAMMVKPSKIVNGKKAYHFMVNVKSNKIFSMFYAVDNTAETFVDFDSLLPLTYSINVKESSRLREVRTFFDRKTNMATHWEKTIVKDEAEEKKSKKEWEIEHYAQNVISAIYYLRNFTLRAGKKMAFYVADDGKNLTFRGEVLREEKLTTPAGEFNTTVMKITFEMGDQFKQTGDNIIWITKDDRRMIVRIESKIKIGTLVAKLKSIQPGI